MLLSMPTGNLAFLEFLKGNLDFMNSVDPSYKDELLTRSGHLNPKYSDRFNILTRPYLNTEYLGFMVDSLFAFVPFKSCAFQSCKAGYQLWH